MIEGTVRSSAGEPVVEARVFVSAAPVSMPDIAALTNEAGGFSLALPATGTYWIECVADGYRAASTEVVVTGEEREVLVAIELVESQ